MKTATRNGFTLVELLVVIAIIGILIALLLPAVQAAREAARRSACTNNMKQTGLAIQNYLSATKALPPGSYWKPGSGSYTSGNEATWVTFILPYLEEKSLYEKIDWVGGSFGSGAQELVIIGAAIPTMRCPSAEPVTSLWLTAWMRGNYAANNGIGPMIEWFAPPVNRMAGVFFLESQRKGRKVSYVSDGLSKTAFASEILNVDPLGTNDDARGVMHYPEGPIYHHNRTPNDRFPDQIRPTGCINKLLTPCQESNPGRAVVMTARSTHAGGVNLLLGDGSVRFVTDSIALVIWQALSTPSAAKSEPATGSF